MGYSAEAFNVVYICSLCDSGVADEDHCSQLTIPKEAMSMMCFGTVNTADDDDDQGPLDLSTTSNGGHSVSDVCTKVCNICDETVEPRDVFQHVQFHLESRPHFGCNYCDFKAKRKSSVQAHITWKHEEGTVMSPA